MTARKKLAVVVGTAAAALTLASITTAAIPDSGVIHACYNKDNGNVRLYDNAGGKPKGCTTDEIAVTWSQQGQQGIQGPQGPQGDTGATGPQGATGPAGPSDAYYYRDTSTTGIDYAGAFDYTVVNYVTLPAGKYLVTGKANVVTSRSGPVIESCFLIAYEAGSYVPNSALDSSTFNLNKDVGINSETAVVTEPLTLTATSAVQLKCAGKDSATDGSMLTAVKVANLTQS